MINRLIIIFSILTLTKEKGYVMGGYDVSKDDKYIIFSAYSKSKNSSSIYRTNIDGTNTILIVEATNGESFWSPKYSNDGKKIVFTGQKGERKNPYSLYIADSNGNNKEKLTEGYGINSMFFSKYGNRILYLKDSNFIKHFPNRDAIRNTTDIYSFEIEKKIEKKLSNLNESTIFHLSEMDSIRLMFFSPVLDDFKLAGSVIYSIDSSKVISLIIPSNNPRGTADMYSAPYFSAKYNQMLLLAPYELYIMDMDTKIARMLYRDSKTNSEGLGMIDDYCMFNKKNKILFRKNREFSFCLINSNGKEFNEIQVIMP